MHEPSRRGKEEGEEVEPTDFAFEKHEEYMVGVVGLDPNKYWTYTLRQNSLLAKAYENRMELDMFNTRNVEFTILKSAFGPSGKPLFKNIKKPQDLYKLPSEKRKIKKSTAVFDPEAAIAAYNTTIKDKDKWLTMKK